MSFLQVLVRTVAEFAETHAAIDHLCAPGVCSVQGDAIGKPIPIEGFLDQTFVVGPADAPAR